MAAARTRFFWTISALCVLTPSVYAFSFTTTTPTQCDDLSVSWTGGTPPFQLVMYPLFGTQRNLSILTTAFKNGAGSFTFQLPFSSGQQFVITMSDATGFGSGGTTNLQTTGASQGGQCNTKDPGPVFQFELNSALQQCRPFLFSGYDGAIQPVTIVGTIPGGQTFLLFPPTGPNNFEWVADVAAGTSLLFTMVDARGRFGGTSHLEIVGATDDATCINSSSPSTTTITSTSSTAVNSQTSSATASPSEHKISIAAIAGIAVGGFVFLAVAVALGLFFLWKRKGNNKRLRDTNLDLTYDPVETAGNHPYSSAVGAAGVSPLTLAPAPGGGYDPTRFTDQPPLQQQAGYAPSLPHTPFQYQAQSSYPSQYHQPNSHHQSPLLYQPPSQSSLPPSHSQKRSLGSEANSSSPYTLASNAPSVIKPLEVSDTASTTMSGNSSKRQAAMTDISTHSVNQPLEVSDVASTTVSGSSKRKAAMTDISTRSRFIVHTDIEDEVPPDQDRIVELPPKYTERPGSAPAGPSHTDTSIGS